MGRRLALLIASGVVLLSVLAFGVFAGATTPKSTPKTATSTTTTTVPPESAQELARCGEDRGLATYHGTNAERDLQRAVPDPLKVADFPCNFPVSIRGISINTHAISLVAGGKLVRSLPLTTPGPLTLPLLTQLIDDPAWIAQTAPGVFELKASLVQQAGTTLDVETPGVSVVRMDMPLAVTFGGSGATANFSGVMFESWNPTKNAPVTTPKLGRPFILYENASQLNISNSTMQYLGSDETSSYGVSWRVDGTNGIVDHSTFQHNFFGVYTYQAAHVVFEDSTFRYNKFYGIDPHTNSTQLTIVNNDVYGNLDHGIVFSRYVSDSIVSGNDVHGNKVNGIMMDFESNGNVISHNVVSGNAEGIVMSGSSQNNVYDNTVKNNGVGIRASHNGADLDNIHNNRITGGRIGIQLYGGATTTQVTKNVIVDSSSVGMLLDSPRSVVRANRVSGTPTGMKVLTATTVVGGTLTAHKIGLEVGPQGFASVRATAVNATKPVSKSEGSIVQLTDTSFHLPSSGSSITGFDIAGALLLLFALLCEVIHLVRGRSVRRFALTFNGLTPGGTLIERPVTRLSKLSVTFHTPSAPDQLPLLPAPLEVKDDRLRRFRPDIEGLRAIAVVFVVLSHAAFGLPGGFVGVDIFFVISGFLITQQLLRERQRHGRASLAKFYARRVRRILPAATLVTCSTLVASYYLVSPLRLASIAKDAIAASLFTVNWRLAAAGTNYFNATAPPSPFQHYWSLSVEEQFYFVWPLLIAGVALLCRRRFNVKWLLTLVLGAIIATSLWASIHVTQVSSSYAYFGTHTRAWELAAGALVAVWATKLTRIPGVVAAVLAWIGIAAIAWAGISLNSSTPYPGWIAQVPVYGAALVIAAGCGMAARGGPEFVLKRSLFQRTGRISYSLYLWHWPLLILLPDFLGHAPTWEERLAAIGIATVLSILTFVLVELPIRSSNWLVVKPRRALTVGVLLICTSLVAALIVGSSGAVPTAPTGPFTTPELSAAITKAYGGAGSGHNSGLVATLAEAAKTNTLPTNVTPPLATVASDFGIANYGCEVGYPTPAPMLPCDQFGDPNGKTQVVFVGDSHAGMWLGAVNELAIQNGWKLSFFAKGGCPIGNYPNFVFAGYSNGPYTPCNSWRAAVLARISVLKPAVVIVASEERSIAAQEPNGLTQTLKAMEKSAGKVVFLADTPRPVADVPDCIAQHQDDVSFCNLPIASTESDGRLAEIAAAKAAGVPVIDPTPWFCTRTTCPVVVQNTIVYLDDSHITGAYAFLREPQLAAAIHASVGEKKR